MGRAGGAGRLAKETWRRVLTRIPAGAGSPHAAPPGALGEGCPGQDRALMWSLVVVTELVGDLTATIPAAGTWWRAQIWGE